MVILTSPNLSRVELFKKEHRKKNRKHFEGKKEGHAFISTIGRKMFRCAKLLTLLGELPAIYRVQPLALAFSVTGCYRKLTCLTCGKPRKTEDSEIS